MDPLTGERSSVDNRARGTTRLFASLKARVTFLNLNGQFVFQNSTGRGFAASQGCHSSPILSFRKFGHLEQFNHLFAFSINCHYVAN